MSTYPKDIKLTINEDKYWIGMSRQELNFHQVIGELIDNAISASGKDEDGDQLPFKIEINIERVSDKVIIDIVDNGIGISEQELIKQIFSPGGSGNSQGILNEHGFGLKNSLCVLTEGNRFKWSIITRDKEALENNKIYKVDGPFSSNMKLTLADENELNNNGEFKINGTGTRLNIETSFNYFSTLYNRAKVFNTLMIRFIEHVGVIYKDYLRSKHNKIIIKWKDALDSTLLWNEFRVKPIEIFYDVDGAKSYDIEITGEEGIATAIYKVGKLDTIKTIEGEGYPYPLKIYYQGNQQTQGVDLVVRGKVVKSAILKDIWAIDPHNSMNKFIGEIILHDSKFKTVNNKLGLDPNNDYTIKLLDELKNDSKYRIEKVTKSKSEDTLKKDFETSLKGIFTGSTVQRERPIWSGSGVKVDVFLQESNKDISVYEFKATTASPLDVYQLLMYWDGIVKDEKKSPVKGRLVAKEIPESVKNIILEINNRQDSLGNKYNLEAKTIAEMGLIK